MRRIHLSLQPGWMQRAARNHPWHPRPGNTEQPKTGCHSSHQSHRVTFSESKRPRAEGGQPRAGESSAAALCAHGRQEAQPPAATRRLPSSSHGALCCNCWFVRSSAAQLRQSHLAFPWRCPKVGPALSAHWEVRELLLRLTYGPNPV